MVKFTSMMVPGLATVAMVAPAFAQGIDKEANPRALDPGRVYFVAWEEAQAAKKLAKQRKFVAAQKRLVEAKRLFDLIAEFHPDFQPTLVARRLQKTEAAIVKLRGAVAAQEEDKQRKLAGLIGEKPERDSRGQGGGQAAAGPAKAESQDATIKSLTAQRNEARREAERARREAEVAKAQLEAVNPVKNRFDAMNRELLKLRIEHRAMQKALEKVRVSKRELNAEYLRSQAEVEQQAAKLAKLKDAHQVEKRAADELVESQMERIEALEAQLAESRRSTAERELKIAQLEKRLDETNLLLREVTFERDNLKKEREQLASLLELKDSNEVKKLIDEKVKLLADLNRAHERIKAFEADGETRDLALREAKTEIVLLKKRLAQVQEENAEYSRQVSDLRDRLRAAERRLAEVESQPKLDPEQQQEAEMLRQVIAKMQKASLAREKGVERMIAAAEKLQLRNPEFQHALAALKGEPIQLSEEEKALLAEEQEKQQRVTGAEIFAPVRGDRKTRLQKLRELREDVEAHQRLARRAYQRGDYETCAEFFETVLEELHPDHFESLCNLGVVRLRLGQPSLAAEHFKYATYQQEDHPFPHVMRGVACYKKGDDEAALEALRRGIELDPANVKAHVVIASAARRLGKSGEAVHALEKAVQLKPDHPTALFNLARLEAELGRFNEAQRHYDLAVKHGALPDDAFAEQLSEARQEEG